MFVEADNTHKVHLIEYKKYRSALQKISSLPLRKIAVMAEEAGK